VNNKTACKQIPNGMGHMPLICTTQKLSHMQEEEPLVMLLLGASITKLDYHIGRECSGCLDHSLSLFSSGNRCFLLALACAIGIYA
jgi:hypothetical protein